MIRQRKQDEIDRNNRRENRARVDHTYNVGDKILLSKEGKQRKLHAPREGPYQITAVYDNGTIEIQKSQAVKERVNIRRVIPYFD
jgi:purine nucleoside permease